VARRRRRSKRGGLSFGGLVVLILSVIFIAQRGWVALAVLWILALVLWLSFFKKTQCDVEKDNGEGCGNPAHGRLRACHLVKHKRAKNDALWAMFKLRNPAAKYRIMWAQPRSSYGRVSPQAEESESKVTRPLYDGTMLGATVLMTFLAGATFALQFHLI
jgi:Ca2+/Na+ antiporter